MDRPDVENPAYRARQRTGVRTRLAQRPLSSISLEVSIRILVAPKTSPHPQPIQLPDRQAERQLAHLRRQPVVGVHHEQRPLVARRHGLAVHAQRDDHVVRLGMLERNGGGIVVDCDGLDAGAAAGTGGGQHIAQQRPLERHGAQVPRRGHAVGALRQRLQRPHVEPEALPAAFHRQHGHAGSRRSGGRHGNVLRTDEGGDEDGHHGKQHQVESTEQHEAPAVRAAPPAAGGLR